jgi:subtilisin family serine protease
MDYPANSQDDILTVGSINSNGVRSSSSGYGIKLDVVAPGNAILSTLPNNSTGSLSGTSMAAPHVAGIAALILSIRPDFTSAEVRQAIESTCTKLSAYSYSNNSSHPNGTWNNQVGHGLVNAYAALQAVCTNINLTNKTFTSNITIIGCDNINVQNVKVQNNAKLTLDANGTTTITSDFEVQLGSEFEIK